MHLDAPLRRITTWLAILGYTLVASGLPLPFGVVSPAAPESVAAKRLAGKDRARPFPCMDKPCGCATAEQCFTSCCCNTPAETLAWARAHQVEPAVLVALELRVDHEPRSAAKAAAPIQSACCSTAALETEPSCCATASAAPRMADAASVDAVSTAHDEPSDEPRSRTVTLRAMLACGGIVAEWFAAGAALPPPQVEVSVAMHVLGVCLPGDEAGECLRASPAAPPPRAA